jgi:uncharacterized protein YdhG (YjbR/CyaY superfamily)
MPKPTHDADTAGLLAVNAYLAALPSAQRAALQRLRRTIRTVLPQATECISYQMPAFRHEGRVVVWMAAWKNHCAFYPGGGVAAFQDRLGAYQVAKGTIRFRTDQTLPTALVRAMVRERLARLGPPRTRRPSRPAAKSRSA